MGKRILFALQTLFVFACMLYAIAGAVQSVGTNNDLYFELQMRENVPAVAGLSEEDLMRLNRRLAVSLYLGEVDWLQTEWVDGKEVPLAVTVHGVKQPAFNEREIQHMRDCCRLFDLLGDLRWGCCILAFVLLAILCAIYVLMDRMRRLAWGKAVWLASGIILVPLGIFALWAAVDFSSAFTFFHKILFTNDLWLLNPETDLLINICPQSMFMNMGLRIALRSASVLLGWPLLITIVNRISEKRKRKQNEVSDL